MPEKAHKKLVLWHKAVHLVVSVYGLTRRFPVGERFGLAAQMQRAAVSIPSNVAEGAARRGRKEYHQFVYTARGSLSELDTQVEIAGQLGYLTPCESANLQAELDEVSRLLNGVIAYLSRDNGPKSANS
jgi:four helix bundle protein